MPGAVVVDLGSGTGILGLLACQAGAKRVYSIEETGLIELARDIGRTNGLADRIRFIKGLSTRVDLPEPADVILADQIGHFGFEAGLFDYFSDAPPPISQTQRRDHSTRHHLLHRSRRTSDAVGTG